MTNDNSLDDASDGAVNRQLMYHKHHSDVPHIFPEWVTREPRTTLPHDHASVNPNGAVKHMREGNQVVDNYRDWRNN